MNKATKTKLARLTALMEQSLSESTGLNAKGRKTVTYWTLGTHTLQTCESYALLALLGKMGCGKSQALSIIDNFARNPVRISLRGTTLPMLRDRLIQARESTAVIEEAGNAWHDRDSSFERLLSDRYSRSSAETAFKVQKEVGEGGKGGTKWQGASAKFFGATVLHRRIGFRDAALDGRTITVRFRPNHDRQYHEFSAADPWNKEGHELIDGLAFQLPKYGDVPGVAARTKNTYNALLALADELGDAQIIKDITADLLQATAELKEAQGSEPDGLILRAILFHVFTEPNVSNPDASTTVDLAQPDWSYIRIGTLKEYIWKEHRMAFDQRQIAQMARELGFTTNVSHGVTVVAPTPATLVRACDACEYEDEAVKVLRESLAQTINSDAPPREKEN
jgi:hypothetical protein